MLLKVFFFFFAGSTSAALLRRQDFVYSSRPRMSRVKCSIPGCGAGSGDKGVTLFGLPKLKQGANDIERQRHEMVLGVYYSQLSPIVPDVRRKKLMKICNRHFEPCMLDKASDKDNAGFIRRPKAVPTFFLCNSATTHWQQGEHSGGLQDVEKAEDAESTGL